MLILDCLRVYSVDACICETSTNKFMSACHHMEYSTTHRAGPVLPHSQVRPHVHAIGIHASQIHQLELYHIIHNIIHVSQEDEQGMAQ